MARNEGKDSRSPREKRSSTEDPLKYSTDEPKFANENATAARNKQPSPWRHLDAEDNPEDGSPA